MAPLQKLAKKRVEKLYCLLENCSLCPRKCGINRIKGKEGYCRMGKDVVISSYGPHFGEERELVGQGGSGTIFLTGCNLHCLYCQNYDISTLNRGYEVTIEKLANIMLSLQKMGCHNINFVTPTHFTPQIVGAVVLAKEKGLDLPIVYNCGGYEDSYVLSLLEGIIDIYMPDVKYSETKISKEYSNAPDYFEVAKEALGEMHKQVGDLVTDKGKVATSGLLVRHLVLPGGLAGTGEIMHFIAKDISPDTYVNIMDQYRPCFKAGSFPELDRVVTENEYREAVEIAKKEGLHRGFKK
jgi:putative pyruvate formate lyase activating enzyme